MGRGEEGWGCCEARVGRGGGGVGRGLHLIPGGTSTELCGWAGGRLGLERGSNHQLSGLRGADGWILTRGAGWTAMERDTTESRQPASLVSPTGGDQVGCCGTFQCRGAGQGTDRLGVPGSPKKGRLSGYPGSVYWRPCLRRAATGQCPPQPDTETQVGAAAAAK